jgi:hypothetical protein
MLTKKQEKILEIWNSSNTPADSTASMDRYLR